MSAEFGSDRPKLDARLQSAGLFIATPGSSTHYFVLPFDLMFNGLQFYAYSSNKGDLVNVEMQYLYGETWKRYQKYSKNWYVFPNQVTEIKTIPAYPLYGMRIAFSYTNEGDANVDFAVNLYTYVPVVNVDVANGEEGIDW
jgi:hypothetical protein